MITPLWKTANPIGKPRIFKTPKKLWTAVCEYFQWIEDNPLEEQQLFAYQGSVTKAFKIKMRAMTLSGLCVFLNINKTTLRNYKAKPEYVTVFEKIDDILFNQKFEGAAAGLLNANIIARDLGLMEHTVTEHKGEIDLKNSPEDQMKKRGIPVPVIDIEDIGDMFSEQDEIVKPDEGDNNG